MSAPAAGYAAGMILHETSANCRVKLIEPKSDTRQGDGRLPQPVRLAVIDMSRFIECLPADVRKKLSLHDIRRVCDNYRKRPCGECHLQPGETCDICGAIQPNTQS